MDVHPLFDIGLAERARLRGLPPDEAIAVAAAARDGVLTHAQLIALGLSKAAISRRLKRKLLFVRHRGVYAVGRFDLTHRGRLRAALLRCGRSAALSHHTAATQAGLVTRRERIAITVTGTPHQPERRSGIELHYTDRWRPGEVVWIGGLPCTSVARTIADLAGASNDPDLRRAWNGADRQRLLDVGPLREQIARGRAGAGLMRARIENFAEAPPTESELEDLFLDVCEAGGLRRPVCQWPLAVEDRSGRVDFVFWPERVAVEVDGRAWHAIQEAHLRDRAKDLALREAGFDPHRYTHRQLTQDGPRVAAVIARALAERQDSSSGSLGEPDYEPPEERSRSSAPRRSWS